MEEQKRRESEALRRDNALVKKELEGVKRSVARPASSEGQPQQMQELEPAGAYVEQEENERLQEPATPHQEQAAAEQAARDHERSQEPATPHQEQAAAEQAAKDHERSHEQASLHQEQAAAEQAAREDKEQRSRLEEASGQQRGEQAEPLHERPEAQQQQQQPGGNARSQASSEQLRQQETIALQPHLERWRQQAKHHPWSAERPQQQRPSAQGQDAPQARVSLAARHAGRPRGKSRFAPGGAASGAAEPVLARGGPQLQGTAAAGQAVVHEWGAPIQGPDQGILQPREATLRTAGVLAAAGRQRGSSRSEPGGATSGAAEPVLARAVPQQTGAAAAGQAVVRKQGAIQFPEQGMLQSGEARFSLQRGSSRSAQGGPTSSAAVPILVHAVPQQQGAAAAGQAVVRKRGALSQGPEQGTMQSGKSARLQEQERPAGGLAAAGRKLRMLDEGEGGSPRMGQGVAHLQGGTRAETCALWRAVAESTGAVEPGRVAGAPPQSQKRQRVVRPVVRDRPNCCLLVILLACGVAWWHGQGQGVYWPPQALPCGP